MILVLERALAQYRMKDEVKWINYLEACDMPINCLLNFGAYDSWRGYYMILSWIPGINAQKLLRNEPNQVCERYGKIRRISTENPCYTTYSY